MASIQNSKFTNIIKVLFSTAKLSNRLDPDDDQVNHVAQPHQGPSCLQATMHFDRIDKGMYFYTLRPSAIHGLCSLH